jgi:hypothetical protein
MKVVSEETGEILHTATIAKEDFPKIVVVDDFVYNHQEDEYGASHGRTVCAFLNRFNPFLNVEKQESERFLRYPCRDWNGQIIMKAVLDDQGNQIIENGKVKQKVMTVGCKLNTFRTLLNRLGMGERIDGVNHSIAGIVSMTDPSIDQPKQLRRRALRMITGDASSNYLTKLNDLKELTHYGRSPIDPRSPLKFYQGAGNSGRRENASYILMSCEAFFLHPNAHLVGGLDDAGQKHPKSNGWYRGQLNKIPFVNASAPFEYTIRSNQHGFNFTGGNPDLDDVDITREKIEANLNACGLKMSYEDFIKQLPPEIEGTSFATPWRLAENFKAFIVNAVKANEGTLPRGLDPDFYKRLETLGIKIPVQGEPQYNPKK